MTADDTQEKGADVSLKVAGQEFNLRNVKSLNTIVTCLNFFAFCVLAVFLYFADVQAQKSGGNDSAEHKAIVISIEKSSAAMVQAIKEMQSVQSAAAMRQDAIAEKQAAAQRETNCLLSLPPDRRVNAAETCRRIAR